MNLNQKGYDAWSSIYDDYPNPTVAVDEMHFWKHWQHLKGIDVIEVGCGTGRNTQKLVRQGNRVVGIDLSNGMLEVAKKRLSDAAKLLEADFVTYDGFAAHQFDALVTSLVIEHIKDLNAFFKRAATVLKPGGACYISEIHPLKAAAGSRANFKDPKTGRDTYLDSFPHSSEEIESAAQCLGFRLQDTVDVLGDQNLVTLNPEWSRYLGKSMIKIWTFRAPN